MGKKKQSVMNLMAGLNVMVPLYIDSLVGVAANAPSFIILW